MNDDVALSYVEQIRPIKKGNTWFQTRADKETRYNHYLTHKDVAIETKERWSIELLKNALINSKKPVISCSFGIDSVIDIFLTRKALEELGRDPSDIDIVWNDTANEFREVRLFQKELTEKWGLHLITTKPKKTLKHIISDNGGITSDYFTARKGQRKEGRPLSEKCCGSLKHEPMRRAIKGNQWDLVIVGLRADESRQRLKAGLRDGEYFYSSSEWKAFVCRPILWWTERDVWDYVEKENVPYNDLYKKNLILNYPNNTKEIVNDNRELFESVGLDCLELEEEQTQIVDRRQVLALEPFGFKFFTPRTGCMMCPIPIKYGYMQWMRINNEKVFNAMIYNLGYGSALLGMMPEDVKEEIKYITGVELTEENAFEHLKDILAAKPCAFDRF